MRLSELEALCQDGSDPEVLIVEDDGAFPVEDRGYPKVIGGRIYLAASTLHSPEKIPAELTEEA